MIVRTMIIMIETIILMIIIIIVIMRTIGTGNYCDNQNGYLSLAAM